MAFYYTRSRTRRPDDDVEPDSISSDPLLDSTFVRPQVKATGGSEPMSAEPAESVSAPINLPLGLPPSEGMKHQQAWAYLCPVYFHHQQRLAGPGQAGAYLDQKQHQQKQAGPD